jgi:glycosyltransferase involved in cell wall biosynthesis
MRILLVGNFGPDAQQSMQRYAAWLEPVLTARGYRVTVLRPRPFFARLTSRPALQKYLGYLDKFVLFPPHLRRLAKKHDLVHVLDHSNSMYLRMVRGTPCLVTCHDLLAVRAARGEFSDSPTRKTSGRLLQKWILSGLRTAPNVLCVSSKTASDLKVLASETGRRTRVIYNPLNWDYGPGAPLPEALLSRLGLRSGEPYLLHVGGSGWYKNRTGVLNIYARLIAKAEFSGVRLVMAGAPWSATMRELAEELELGDRAIEAAGPTNEELLALYGNALALLFPSLEEGFGWPVLEAQACGCPVITSARAPMTEVAGEAAIFVDPTDPQAAGTAIAEGLQRREWLRAAGFRNMKRFDEAELAGQYCAFYEDILKDASSPVR